MLHLHTKQETSCSMLCVKPSSHTKLLLANKRRIICLSSLETKIFIKSTPCWWQEMFPLNCKQLNINIVAGGEASFNTAWGRDKSHGVRLALEIITSILTLIQWTPGHRPVLIANMLQPLALVSRVQTNAVHQAPVEGPHSKGQEEPHPG